jgi:P-type conjugative transfer protein TrbG
MISTFRSRLCLALSIVLTSVALTSSSPGAQTLDPYSPGPKETVDQANAAARVEPTQAGYLNAMQIWPYNPSALYQVYTRPGRITDIALQPGEQLIDISAPDTIRWILGNTTSGEREAERVHVSIKPTRSDLQTNLIIYTSRRTYYIEVSATPATWMAAVAWEYPQDRLAARSTNDRSRTADSTAEGLPLERLNFHYEITGRKLPWRPVLAFDDGAKVYIQFPPDIAHHDLPPLFLVGPRGATQLVNYRVQSPYYIVDRLFDVAELRFGDKRAQTVRIARTEAKAP